MEPMLVDNSSLESFIVNNKANFSSNLDTETLVKHSLEQGEGDLSDTGALIIKTGRYTGRSPKDRFIVKDGITADKVDWGDVNFPFKSEDFDVLEQDMLAYAESKKLYLKDAKAVADNQYTLHVRLLAEKPWSAHFVNNMFLRLTEQELSTFKADWHILCLPGFKANPEKHNTRQENFAVINFSKKMILIGGTGYTGEIKKGIFSVLNFTLPVNHGVFPMHCSANVGENGETAVFFGLSGTGKTTLSTDAKRKLIGDDEHGWSDSSVFNFEGGCYAKCINLSEKKEPEIFKAIKPGALLENIVYDDAGVPDFDDASITQNTRVSYPIYHIDNIQEGSKAGIPTNIFFLTCDAFGILPPISRLTESQAMYYFLLGYTAKVAGTEDGVDEPQATFSACFGAPFLPLHPTEYADMLGKKMAKHDVNVWLVNTGWVGGPCGVSDRISLKYTRAMITAALNGQLDQVNFKNDNIFGLAIPESCPNVPTELLDPAVTWSDTSEYQTKAEELARMFVKFFAAYEDKADDKIKSAAPKI